MLWARDDSFNVCSAYRLYPTESTLSANEYLGIAGQCGTDRHVGCDWATLLPVLSTHTFCCTPVANCLIKAFAAGAWREDADGYLAATEGAALRTRSGWRANMVGLMVVSSFDDFTCSTQNFEKHPGVSGLLQHKPPR